MSDQKVAERIQKLLEDFPVTDWERGFLESLGESLKKWKTLSVRQHSVLQKIEANYTAEKMLEREQWEANFTPEMRQRSVLVAKYYLNHGFYFTKAAHQILEDETYIPPRALYNKMCLNKYAEGVMENHLSDPEFPDGTFARLRAGIPGRRNAKNMLVLVVSHGDDVCTHAKGAKPVCVLPVGESTSFWTEERYLKRASRKNS